MSEELREVLAGWGVPPLAIVAILSAAPISEVRGGIPAGCILGLPIWQILAVAIPCNVLAVMPIILWFEPMYEYFKDKPVVGRVFEWVLRRARKREDLVKKYGVFALTMFVALPLPITGAWTGSVIASVFNFGFWRSVVCVTLGVCIASTIMTLVCMGVISLW
ncbi:MAG TPA: small multi-drug export protein [Armatimonadota bacterium]|nr:small multi-drug export protein [Armatimonadota bacterium]